MTQDGVGEVRGGYITTNTRQQKVRKAKCRETYERSESTPARRMQGLRCGYRRIQGGGEAYTFPAHPSCVLPSLEPSLPLAVPSLGHLFLQSVQCGWTASTSHTHTHTHRTPPS